MIIDKIAPYWTEEHEQRRADLDREERDLLFNKVRNWDTEEDRKINNEILERLAVLESKRKELKADAENNYIKAHSQKAILADVEEILSALEKSDFLISVKRRQESLADIKTLGKADEESLAILVELAEENYNNCFDFIISLLRVQLNALAGSETNTEKVLAKAEKKAEQWYIKPQPSYFPIAHGKATDAFAFMNTRRTEIDRVTGSASIEKFDVQLVITKLQNLKATLGMSTDKLLSTAMARFTEQNDFSRRTGAKEIRREISMPLREYAQLLGYDVIEHETSTPEEAEREKKRAKNQLDNARKAVKKDLDIIHSCTLTWEEKIRGKERDFDRVSLVTRTAIKNGIIKISFTPEIAEYLKERNLITQYPTKLLGLDNRQNTAYHIGRKLIEYYNIDQNQQRGTHDRISIPALLKYTDLPSFEEVQKTDRGHWAERIKEPLERALDTLTQEGILQDWKYTHAKGIDLTEAEAYTITSYDEFAKLYLLFVPADKVDHTERLQAKQEKNEAKKAKTRQKKASENKKR